MAGVTSEKIKTGLQIIIGGQLVAGAYLTYSGDEKWYKKVVMPFFQLFGAEGAHWLAVKAAKYGMIPRIKQQENPKLELRLWGREFKNPVGLAAGFDKHGECVDSMLKTGFGFVEVGSVTPQPQEGNPKPRMFRLKEDKAVINRYGFNSDGHEIVYQRLAGRNQQKVESGIVGVNLGKNKSSEDAVQDYLEGVRKFGDVADYLVINVSSPNTPGLRAMQGHDVLQNLVQKVTEERNKLTRKDKPPLLIKIAPDLTEQDKVNIAAVVARPGSGVDGLIVSNTTTSRPESLQNSNKEESGGLSGQPLKDLATATVKDMYKLTMGKLPIVGVGGVSSGKDVLEKMKAGASLVQIYTAFGYEGPPIVKRIKVELTQLLEEEGFEKLSDAVGADFKS